MASLDAVTLEGDFFEGVGAIGKLEYEEEGLGEWLFVGGAYISKCDDEVERAEVVECRYVDWAEGGSLNTYQLWTDFRLR
jgi:hypothetical protein